MSMFSFSKKMVVPLARNCRITGHRLIPSRPVIPADHRSIRIDLIGTAGGRVGFLGVGILGRRCRGRDSQGVALPCEGDAAPAVGGEIVVTQYFIVIRDRSCIAARCVPPQLDGVAPARCVLCKAGDHRGVLHRRRDLVIPQPEGRVAARVHAAIERAVSPIVVGIGVAVFADQLPDDGLRGGPFFRVDDGTAVPVAGHRAVVGTGIAQGHRQCNAALHRSGQVIPAGTGSLLIGAAVIGVNARLDAVSHRAIRIFHVVEGAAAAEAAGSRDGQICNGRRCALTIIILAKCDLVRIDVDPVLDRHAGSIGGHRQCCRHDQRQHKGCHVFECFQMASSSTKDKTPLFPERSCVLFFLSLHREHR